MHDATALRHRATAVRGELHDLGACVIGIGDPPHVPARLEIVHHEHHPLLRDAGATRELGETRPRPAIDVQEHGRVARTQIGVAALLQR